MKYDDLNKLRTEEYCRSLNDKDFLIKVGRSLQYLEQENYEDTGLPFIFVFGLPRSGTVLLNKILARGFDCGYVNNFIARFWLSPIVGTELFRILYGNSRQISLEPADIATTCDISDVHEFGYFWRHWLKIKKLEDGIIDKSDEIDWRGLRNKLLGIQQSFSKPLIMKNVFGIPYIKKLEQMFKNVLFVYIEREAADVAISLEKVRKKIYGHNKHWIGTVPIEYFQIKDLEPVEQIAKQVYYLQKYYREILVNEATKYIVINYQDLCYNPNICLNQINNAYNLFYEKYFKIKRRYLDVNRLNYKKYSNRTREKFNRIFEVLQNEGQGNSDSPA